MKWMNRIFVLMSFFVIIVFLCMIAMTQGCASLEKTGLTAQNPAVKQVVLLQVQKAMVKEGLSDEDVDMEKLGEWYDIVVSIPQLKALAADVEKNAAVSNRVQSLIEEYLGAVTEGNSL